MIDEKTILYLNSVTYRIILEKGDDLVNFCEFNLSNEGRFEFLDSYIVENYEFKNSNQKTVLEIANDHSLRDTKLGFLLINLNLAILDYHKKLEENSKDLEKIINLFGYEKGSDEYSRTLFCLLRNPEKLEYPNNIDYGLLDSVLKQKKYLNDMWNMHYFSIMPKYEI